MTKNELLESIAKSLPKDDEVKQQLEELGGKMSAAGITPNFGQAPELPDCPPCDHCGKEFEGHLLCGQCKCVSYCSRDCQKRHWKKHKGECAIMDQQCQEAAQNFIAAFSNNGTSMAKKMSPSLWEALDESSPYKKALALGLNGVIEKMLKEEAENVQEQFKSGVLASYTQMLMCTLFRSGRHIPGGLFSGVDAYRIKKYVLSSDEAFGQWFKASVTIISVFANASANPRAASDRYFWGVQKIARDIAAAWSLVFTSLKASKAILLGASKQPDDDACARTKWIIGQLKPLLPLFPQDSPDNSAVEGQVNQFTAMIDLRCEELEVDAGGDFVTFLGLKGTRRQMYNDFAIPFAEATMKKGKALTTAESQQALMAHAQSGRGRRRNTTSAAAAGTNKAGGNNKKKGKNNRK